MKRTLLPVLLALASPLLAQPQLTSGEMLGFGSVMNFSYADNYAIIDTTIQGAGVTWDFSDLDAIGGQDFTMEIVDPVTTSHGDDFPEANYAYHEDYGSDDAYRYFILSDEQLERIGSYSGSVNTYTNSQEEYIFPLEVGVSNIDTWDNTLSSFGGGDYNLTCVGSGTLILPDDTYEDALMVRVYLSEGDFIEVTAYFWYSSENGAILLTYYDGDGFWIGDSGIFLTSLDVVSEVEEENDPAVVMQYNNPVNDVLHIRFQSYTFIPLTYSVVNITGEIVANGTYDASASYESLDIPAAEFSAGIYHLVFYDGSGKMFTEPLKFMKL